MERLSHEGGPILKILVTGTSGFIGTSLAEFFSQRSNYQVYGLDLYPPKERFDEVTYFQTDLVTGHGSTVADSRWTGERRWLEDIFREYPPDAVVHMAAQARVDPSLVDPFGTYLTNVVATLNLAKMCADRTPSAHFVYASSEAIYGQATHYPTTENENFRPISPYASSKIASDVMIQQLNDRLGMKTCVLRSGMGMGPRSSPKEQVVSKFIVKALENKPLMFPEGNVVHPTRDVNPVQNFVEAARLVLESKATGVYNIASGRELSILTIAQQIVEAVQKRLGKPITGVEFSPAFKYRENEEGMRTCLSIDKARRDLGYEPKWTFEEALGPTIEWLIANKDNYWR